MSQCVIMRRAVLQEDEGRQEFIRTCSSRKEAKDWIRKQKHQYFSPSDYYVVGDKGERPIIQTTHAWKEGHRSGLLSAIAFLKQWDNQLAPVLEGRKMSSIVLCKFNLTKRKHPEKVKCKCIPNKSGAGSRAYHNVQNCPIHRRER